jgi:hypothetical protein
VSLVHATTIKLADEGATPSAWRASRWAVRSCASVGVPVATARAWSLPRRQKKGARPAGFHRNRLGDGVALPSARSHMQACAACDRLPRRSHVRAECKSRLAAPHRDTTIVTTTTSPCLLHGLLRVSREGPIESRRVRPHGQTGSASSASGSVLRSSKAEARRLACLGIRPTARIRPSQQRAAGQPVRPGLLLCQEAGVSPCAPARPPERASDAEPRGRSLAARKKERAAGCAS